MMTFRQTLLAKLESIPALTAIVGDRIYPGALPASLDLGATGPALVFTIATYPRGHVLEGQNGTADARVIFTACAYRQAQADAITLAIWEAIDRVPENPWGDGTIEIMSVTQQDESEQADSPRAGTDQWIYRVISDYLIRHRTIFPFPIGV